MLNTSDARAINANRGATDAGRVAGIKTADKRASDPAVAGCQGAAHRADPRAAIITDLQNHVAKRRRCLNRVAPAAASEAADHQ